MSMWEFAAAVDGYAEAHSPDDRSLSASEVDDLWNMVTHKMGTC